MRDVVGPPRSADARVMGADQALLPHRERAAIRYWRSSSTEIRDMLTMKRQEAEAKAAAEQAPQQQQQHRPGGIEQKGVTASATQGTGLAREDSAGLIRHGSAGVQRVGSGGVAKPSLLTKSSQGSGQLRATDLFSGGAPRPAERTRQEPMKAPAVTSLAGPAAAGSSSLLDIPSLGRLKTTASAPLPEVQQAAPGLAPRMSMPAASARDPRLPHSRLASPAATPSVSPTQAAAAASKPVWQPPVSNPGAQPGQPQAADAGMRAAPPPAGDIKFGAAPFLLPPPVLTPCAWPSQPRAAGAGARDAPAPAGVLAKTGAAPELQRPPAVSTGAGAPRPHAAGVGTEPAPATLGAIKLGAAETLLPPVDPRTGMLSPRLADADATTPPAAPFVNPFAAARPQREGAAAPEAGVLKRKAAEQPGSGERPAKHSRLAAESGALRSSEPPPPPPEPPASPQAPAAAKPPSPRKPPSPQAPAAVKLPLPRKPPPLVKLPSPVPLKQLVEAGPAPVAAAGEEAPARDRCGRTLCRFASRDVPCVCAWQCLVGMAWSSRPAPAALAC